MATSSNKKTTKPNSGKPTPWARVFSKTAGLPCVFTVHDSNFDEVNGLVRSLGLPLHHKGGVFCTWYWATPLLDGYVLQNSTEGFPAGRLPSGLRVVGTNPVRLLCHLLDLTQPRRFPSEVVVPTTEELATRLEEQQSRCVEALPAASRELLFASDKSDLVVLSYNLYGEVAIPDGYRGREIPAPGEWGEAGLTRQDYHYFTQAGVALSDAVQWKRLISPPTLQGFMDAGVTLAEVQAWNREGIDPVAVPRLEAIKASVQEVKQWVEGGGYAYNYPTARERGLTLADVRPYMELGYPDLQAIDLAVNKVPVELVRALDEVMHPKPWERQIITDFAIRGMDQATLARWVSLGVTPEQIRIAVHKSIPVEVVEEYLRTPKTWHQIETFIRRR